jgi:hypothetical protein
MKQFASTGERLFMVFTNLTFGVCKRNYRFDVFCAIKDDDLSDQLKSEPICQQRGMLSRPDWHFSVASQARFWIQRPSCAPS